MRRIRGFTLIEVLVVLAIIAVLAALIIPAVMQATSGKQATSPTTATTATSGFYPIILETIEHDGHRFVVGKHQSFHEGIAMIHSPSCPCLKNQPAER